MGREKQHREEKQFLAHQPLPLSTSPSNHWTALYEKHMCQLRKRERDEEGQEKSL